MKILSVFLFVFSIYIFGHVSGTGIRIVNELKSHKNLWMRCYSKNDVIGPKIIPVGYDYVNSFRANIWGTTRFMCTLKQGPNYRHYQNFTAFKQYTAYDNGADWDWRVREDGIYLKKEGGLKKSVDMNKVYDWIN
ncbi:Plant self-incompatibility S1 [Arabidopsis suecica]|uniref:S-protein homolog n=1 Tax=Arabidopsis suecica TaxID=45249 RepID=A0A8T2FA72_ARASU|nr:Plant self-incompatibility S1 [Arabidopsis suecica]